MSNFNARNNIAAFEAGQAASKALGTTDGEYSFPAYRDAAYDDFDPCVQASICFVYGFKGNEFPLHDERVATDNISVTPEGQPVYDAGFTTAEPNPTR